MKIGLYDVSGLPPKTAKAVADDHARGGRRAGMWNKFPGNGSKLLQFDSNPKTSKSRKLGVLTGILYLTPARGSGAQTLCAVAELAGCVTGCLATAGRGKMHNVALARLRKTLFLKQYPAQFHAQLEKELCALERRAARLGLKPAVRLNGTSDLSWERHIAAHPSVQAYDYTKIMRRLRTNTIPNYHMVGSYSGKKPAYAKSVLDAARDGYSIAVVFRTPAMVAQAVRDGWNGLTVVPGDEHDLIYRWPAGVVLALKAKGDAKQDRSGFVQDL